VQAAGCSRPARVAADLLITRANIWTVAPLNPMLTLYAATTPATLDGKHPDGWVPEQKISITEAVTAYTSGSAFAEFQESVKGTIERGQLADIVILSDDVFSLPAARLKNVQVLTIIVGGKVVHQRRP
jgi:predicted amidohydrolase YtcJ